MIGLNLTVSAMIVVLAHDIGQDRPTVPPPPPPSRGFAVLSCNVTTLQGQHLKAEVQLDYSKNRISPWVAVKSSAPALVASMPSTEALARPNSLDRYASLKLGDKEWQVIGYSVESSTSDRTTVEFYRQDGPSTPYGTYHNTLSAAGICAVKYVSTL